MEKDSSILLGVHSQLLQSQADFFGDYFGGIGLDNPAIAAKQIEEQPIRDCGTVRSTSSLDPGDSSVGELPVEFCEEPRLADAGLTDDADRWSVPVGRQLKEIRRSGAV